MRTKKQKGKKTFIITCVVLTLVVACAYAVPGLLSAGSGRASAESTGEVRTVAVGTQDIEKAVSGTGQILTGDEETIALSDSKKVDEVLVDEGQAVKDGDTLLTYKNGTKLKSTVNGVVNAITIAEDVRSGDRYPSVSDTITVMNTDNLVIELAVDETDLQSIKAGQAASITVNALPDAEYTGEVTKISETGEYSNGSSTFTVTITLKQTENVKIGMSADVRIVTASAKGAVAVPIEAVTGTGDGATVMVVGADGTASPVSVTLGLANDAYVQILSGVSEGETIQYAVQAQSASSGFGGLNGMSGFNRDGMSLQNGDAQSAGRTGQNGGGSSPAAGDSAR